MAKHTVTQLVEMLNRVIGGTQWDWQHDLRVSTPVTDWRRDHGGRSLDEGHVEFKRQVLEYYVDGEPRPAYRIVAEGTIVDAAVEVDGQWVTMSREIGKSIEQS